MFEQTNITESEESGSNMGKDTIYFIDWSKNKLKLDISLEKEISNFLSKCSTKNMKHLQLENG